jgi:lipid-A-disaccharide synthase
VRIWLSAGEASGDRWGGALATALVRANPDVELRGMGGPLMREAGVECMDIPAGGVSGFSGPLLQARTILRTYRRAKREIREWNPDRCVVIDYPDFHMQLIRAVDPRRVVYYIAPQVWAWRADRARTVAQRCGRVITAFEWEREYFTPWMDDDRVQWLGHPLVDDISADGATRSDDSYEVILLPGSRPGEIARNAPTLAKSASELGLSTFLVHQADRAAMVRDSVGDAIPIITGPVMPTVRWARLAIACAGTVTLEAACAGVPLIIVYSADALTALLGRTLVQTRLYGLPNILLERSGDSAVYPELIQSQFTAERVCSMARQLMSEPKDRWRTRGSHLRSLLGDSGVADRVAASVMECGG